MDSVDAFGAETARSVQQAALALHDPKGSAAEVIERLEVLVAELGLGSEATFTADVNAVTGPGCDAVEVAAPDGSVAGVLVWRPADPAAREQVAVLAAHTGVALHTRQRLTELEQRQETLRRVAEHLQDALLPRLPALEHSSIARRYQPAMADTRVGGDFYDVFGLPDDRTLVVVGDVVGKGIEAASRTSRITQTLRALALQDLPLDELLCRCDEQVTFQDPDIMATVWCGLYDDRTGELTFSSLGHPPALLLRHSSVEDAMPIRLELQGLPLGMRDLDDSEPECRSRQLGPGDLLVLYTDGVVEAAGDYLAGQESLLRAIEAHRAEALDDLLDHAMADLLADADHLDDALMLLLRRR